MNEFLNAVWEFLSLPAPLWTVLLLWFMMGISNRKLDEIYKKYHGRK